MSLRQRGQRPSEATNEGGYYGGGGGGGGQQGAYGSGNGAQTPQQQPPRPSPPSSGGYAGAGGGYYGYGTPTANAATPTAPGTAAPGYAGYNATPNQPVQQGAYAQTAPPAYGSYGQNQNQGAPSSGGMQARAIQFDSAASGTGGAGYGRQGGAGSYGGYSGGIGASRGGMGGGGGNPYQKSKQSSSGFGLRHVLLSILAITLLVLTGTTLYYRNVMKNAEIELQQAKDFLDKQQRTGGRHGRDGNMDRGRNKKDVKKKKDWPPKKKKGQSEQDWMRNMQVEIKKKTKELEDAKKKHLEVEMRFRTQDHLLQELQGKKQDLLKAIDHTGYLLEDKEYETEKYKAMAEGTEEVEVYMKKREGALFSRIDVLEKKIGRESQREASEWFGPGPHRVELQLEYPKVDDPEADPSTWKRIRNTLTIEMAPLDLMPHTVNLFLQQVHHQLWDGCNFVNNPHHIINVGPSYDDEDREEPHYDHFYERGLDKVSYQEYSDEFPHAQWTVGLAGRPGGPDFYINKIDNSMIHGPGGQTNKDDLHNEADPCFGKVVMEGADGSAEGNVSGKEVLDDINKVPTDRDEGFEIKYPVVIIDARVLAPKENPADGWRAIPPGRKLDGRDGIMPLPEVPHGV